MRRWNTRTRPARQVDHRARGRPRPRRRRRGLLPHQPGPAAGRPGLQKVSVVVAARDIPARKPIEADDVAVRTVPLDATNARASSRRRRGRRADLAVTVLKDQMVTTNLIASAAGGGGFSILGPDETVGPELRPGGRCRSTCPTTGPSAAAPGRQDGRRLRDRHGERAPGAARRGRYYTDKSTKLTYQNVVDPGQGRAPSTWSGRRVGWPRRSPTSRRPARRRSASPSGRRRTPGRSTRRDSARRRT